MAKTIMIVGKGNEVARLSYNSQKNSFKATNFESVVGADVKGNVRINCLSVLVHTMQQLKEMKAEESSEITTVYTIGLVSDMISKGTFKYWINGEGKKLNGDDVSDIELALWNKFTGLYLEMYMNIIIKNVSDCSLPAKPRFKPSVEQQNLAKLAEKVWDRVIPSEPEEEIEEEAL